MNIAFSITFILLLIGFCLWNIKSVKCARSYWVGCVILLLCGTLAMGVGIYYPEWGVKEFGGMPPVFGFGGGLIELASILTLLGATCRLLRYLCTRKRNNK